MEYLGLIGKYPVNRALEDEERLFCLGQNVRHDAQPEHQLSVIQINSTYLELVDKYFGWKGFLTLVSYFFVAMGGLFMFAELIWIFGEEMPQIYRGREDSAYLFVGITSAVTLAFIALFIWIARFESFRFTHYPLRFNRKTRMVYALRLDGTVLSVPWEEVFFTLGRGQMRNCWEVRGHVLSDDKKTVLETFALPYFSAKEDPNLFSQWEFVRRYMEEGPKELIGTVHHLMDVATKRETFWAGFRRLISETGPYPILNLLFAPMMLLISVGRFIAMRTSRIPQWPVEVEAACEIEAGDPYRKG